MLRRMYRLERKERIGETLHCGRLELWGDNGGVLRYLS